MKKNMLFILLCIMLPLCVSCVEIIQPNTPESCHCEYDNWTIEAESTCTLDGVISATCKHCGKGTTKPLTAKGHTLNTISGISPTCTEEGLTEGTECTVCNEVFVEPSIVEKTPHNYINGICVSCNSLYSSQGLEFILNEDKQSYCVKIGDCKDSIVVIPETYNELPITLIKSDSFNNCTFTKISVPSSVLTIENGAFYGCTKLESISLPFVGKSLDSTGKESVFGYIFGDKEFSNSVSAKQAYSSLWAVTYYLPASLTRVDLTNDKIPFGAFSGCSNIQSISTADSIQSVSGYAFLNCTALKSIPDLSSATSVGDCAFQNCTNLVNISIGKPTKAIGDNVFLGCASLTEITVHPDNPTYKSIANNLYSKDGKTFIYYSQGNTNEEFTLADGVTSIVSYAFYGITALKRINLPDGLEVIESSAFRGCSSLINISLPNSVTKIGGSAFLGCEQLTTVVFSSSLTLIESYAFQKCKALTTVILPNSLVEIGNYAFSVCSSLTKVYIPNSVEIIGENVFWRSYDAIIYCEASEAKEQWSMDWNPSNCDVFWSSKPDIGQLI
ncbi:MAG: leucine-rich repeat domain-containing protein [Ruminococcaceae bacterium]|nr:leucine-rich repeat domain-containing protein [Oscillospiraceae bacterium]